MKNSLLILAGAAALSLASCSQEKTTEVSTAPADGMATTTTTTTTTMTPLTDAQIEARAQRIADKMVADMKISDEATKTKIRTVYVNRYKRMNDMSTKYASDTTGMAADRRNAMMAEDEEFKTVFTDPTQYQAYESSRSTYDDSNYQDDASSMAPADNTTSSATDGTMSTMETGKTKMEDGSKIKVKSDGDVKMKDAEGNKLKMAGDDGTIKLKPVDGEKIKQK
ncbi:hypothetical protein ACFP2F_19385 [Hymenobacter artigasi]|uniref:Lipoprotein n=1 Tax=Hymenobacter artigasi TaxID=2719616 RepID=A0ABX1HII6_9BACT|nr:hypothetical protein [Hymenobacter artigasi]NKI90078.1 hypothetical protein [Hymenobacter artigasi]